MLESSFEAFKTQNEKSLETVVGWNQEPDKERNSIVINENGVDRNVSKMKSISEKLILDVDSMK